MQTNHNHFILNCFTFFFVIISIKFPFFFIFHYILNKKLPLDFMILTLIKIVFKNEIFLES